VEGPCVTPASHVGDLSQFLSTSPALAFHRNAPSNFSPGEANMISSAFPYQTNRQRVLDREMAYVEVEKGDPILLLMAIPLRPNFGITCCHTCSH
jgi:hypothetical protein